MTQYTPSSSEPGQRPPNFWNSSRGIASWLLTLDHKRIGVMYLAFGVGRLPARRRLRAAGPHGAADRRQDHRRPGHLQPASSRCTAR
jgi:hypothetical protein